MKKHMENEMPVIGWLDAYTFRKLEQIHHSSIAENDSKGQYLFIELVQFDVPIVFSDTIYPQPPMVPTQSQQHGTYVDGSETLQPQYTESPTIYPSANSNYKWKRINRKGRDNINEIEEGYQDSDRLRSNTMYNNSTYNDYPAVDAPLIRVIDPDQFRENQIERKHRRLNRGAETGLFDKDLKPSATIRDDINKIISYSPVHELTSEEKDKLWKFRYYITRHKQALTKFLKTISWEDPREVKQAIDLLPRWTQIDIDDALELLGPNFHHPTVRAYAVDRLKIASDHELELYLLQLVQALRFEKASSHSSPSTSALLNSYQQETPKPKSSSLAKFLISRAVKNPILGNYFFWYVSVESQEKGAPSIFKNVLNQFQKALKAQEKQDNPEDCSNEEANSNNMTFLNILENQIEFINKILKVATQVKSSKDPRPKKIEKLKQYIADSKNGLLNFPPIPLPLDPTITIVGIVPEDCTVFKSSLSPLKLTLKTIPLNLFEPGKQSTTTNANQNTRDDSNNTNNMDTSHHSNIFPLLNHHQHHSKGKGRAKSSSVSSSTADYNSYGTYSIMFKTGDDLRQDQLVIQIITLMDQLLRNENLDLKLTPYRILATGPRDGALQFILNRTLNNVLAEYSNGILGYLRDHNPDSSNPLGVTEQAMDTYIRSCAGYCVITYILGVGDRHLDNLLICPDGHFFHADFGYILGHDPKPFPPMMKLPIQIIDGMGGINSANYGKFKNYCFSAYTTLRKSANLILNLFALMSHSTIPDIMVERDNAAVLKVMEKFCLDMTEEEAILHFQNLINDSVNAFLPVVIDRFHSLAQYWRA